MKNLRERIQQCKDNEEIYALTQNFLTESPTMNVFKGVSLPDYHYDMPTLDVKETYEQASRWFMQMSGGFAVSAIFRLLKLYPEANKFLDVGSGTGFIVSLAQEIGLEAEGVEMSEYLINLVPEMKGLKIHQQDFFTFEDFGKYDIMYAWNPNPPRMQELAKRILGQCNKKTAIWGLSNGAVMNPDGAIDGLKIGKEWKIDRKAGTMFREA